MEPHYFVALSLSNKIKEVINKQTIEVKQYGDFEKWVHLEDYHLTLAFLGSSSEEQLTTLNQKLQQSINGSKPFTLKINQVGVFGNAEKPRIFWVGVEQNEHLFSLRENVFQCCLETGFTLDSKPFHPHITIARKWKSPFPYSEFETNIQEVFIQEPLVVPVNQVHLYQSDVVNIPKYKIIKSFSF